MQGSRRCRAWPLRLLLAAACADTAAKGDAPDPEVEPEHVIRIGAAAALVQFAEAARPCPVATAKEGRFLDAPIHPDDLDRKATSRPAPE